MIIRYYGMGFLERFIEDSEVENLFDYCIAKHHLLETMRSSLNNQIG